MCSRGWVSGAAIKNQLRSGNYSFAQVRGSEFRESAVPFDKSVCGWSTIGILNHFLQEREAGSVTAGQLSNAVNVCEWVVPKACHDILESIDSDPATSTRTAVLHEVMTVLTLEKTVEFAGQWVAHGVHS